MGILFSTLLFLHLRIHSFIHSPPIKYLFGCYPMPGNALLVGEGMTNSIKEYCSQGKHVTNMDTNKQVLQFQKTSALNKSGFPWRFRW